LIHVAPLDVFTFLARSRISVKGVGVSLSQASDRVGLSCKRTEPKPSPPSRASILHARHTAADAASLLVAADAALLHCAADAACFSWPQTRPCLGASPVGALQAKQIEHFPAFRRRLGKTRKIKATSAALNFRARPTRRLSSRAARAGTCLTTVKNALREARRLNLVTVQERRRRGQKSLTNLVRIVSPEWMAWIGIKGHG
jgi:hypothetical protein